MTNGAQKVALSISVAATPAEVWAVIGNFQDMSWHPAVHFNTGANGNASAATRLLTLGGDGGPTIAEALVDHSDTGMAYGYRITEVLPEVLPVANYSSQLSVRAGSGGGAEVEWQGAFEPTDPTNGTASTEAVTGVYKLGLDALVERFGAGS